MALFVTFEGGEGSGKTVQARALHRRLSRRGIPAILLHEPGGTLLGDRISRWLRWARDMRLSPLSELFLFNASRAQLVADVIRPNLADVTRPLVADVVRPNLADGTVVVCDRYTDSTLAYQGYGRGLDLAMVRRINRAATGGVAPDLTVLLDIPVEQAFARKAGGGLDRFETEDVAFHQRVRRGYLEMSAADPERWLVVDGLLSRRRIGDAVWRSVSQLLDAGTSDGV